MRIELPNRFNHKEVADWMIKNFGMPVEGKTWFWSYRVYKEIDSYGNTVDKHREGVKIWSDNPSKVLMAQIRWSA